MQGKKAVDDLTAEVKRLKDRPETRWFDCPEGKQCPYLTPPLPTVWVRYSDGWQGWKFSDPSKALTTLYAGGVSTHVFETAAHAKAWFECLFPNIATVKVWREPEVCPDCDHANKVHGLKRGYIMGTGVGTAGRGMLCPTCNGTGKKPPAPEHEWVYAAFGLPKNPVGRELISRMLDEGQTSWTGRTPDFGVRRLTKDEVKQIITRPDYQNGEWFGAFRDGKYICDTAQRGKAEFCIRQVLAMLTPAVDAVTLDSLEVVGDE